MPNRFYQFFKSQQFFFIFSVLATAYFLAFATNYFFPNLLSAFFQISVGFFLLIVGSGFMIAIILQWAIKKHFGQWEFITIALLSSLLVFPTLLLGEFFFLGKVNNWLPAVNFIVLWVAAGILLYLEKTTLPSFSSSSSSRQIKILRHPLTFALFLGMIFTLIQILSYPALPDLDPYKWLYKYVYQFANFQLDYSERPLFGSYIFIGTRLLGLDIFHFFKYVLPFIFLIVLFPAYLTARVFPEQKKQWIFLLFVFTSPVILLYAQTPMPQVFFIILSYFFIFSLLYSFEKKEEFFLYAAGLAALMAIFYHQAAIIIFAVWVISMVFSRRRLIFSDKKTLFLILLLLASNFNRLWDIYRFIISWIKVIFSMVFGDNNLNLLYPAQYSNIDRNPMGWETADGVIKFYAFYIGPLLGTIVFIFLILFFSRSNFRSFFWEKIKNNVSILIAFLSFLVFFVIAEVFPRFPNIALLPERAWIFSGIFAAVFLFILFSYIKKIPVWSLVIFVLCLSISLSGAIYINYLKRYLISPEQWNSAEWIKNNLPENRIFLSYGHKNLLPVHANAPLIRIPPEAYCGDFRLEDYNHIMTGIIADSQLKTFYEPFLKFLDNTSKNALKVYQDSPDVNKRTTHALNVAETVTGQAAILKKSLNEETQTEVIYPLSYIPHSSSPVPVENAYEQYREPMDELLEKNTSYIYYARKNNLNPYRMRPYGMLTWGMDSCPNGKFFFDKHSEKFKRVYVGKDEEVIIWQVL